jgi:hypothetical protein
VQIVEAEAELERRDGDVLVAMENVNRARMSQTALLPTAKTLVRELQASRQGRSETQLDSARGRPAESTGLPS